jgi:hypothetical protein
VKETDKEKEEPLYEMRDASLEYVQKPSFASTF